MRTPTMTAMSNSLRRTVDRLSWMIALTAFIGLAGLVILGVAGRPPNPTPSASSMRAAASDVAMQHGSNSVDAHPNVQLPQRTAVPPDPAQQYVMEYVRAHDATQLDRATPVDPSMQAVLDYLRVHRK